MEVYAKILSARYAEQATRWTQVYRDAVGRDRLWITPDEVAALGEGTVPGPLVRRITRYHLLDNTRAEPRRWRPTHVHELELRLEGKQLEGRVALGDEERGYEADLLGTVESSTDHAWSFDVEAQQVP